MKYDQKNILVIMSRIPYPPVGGDRVKGYNLIKILSKNYKVTLLSLTDKKMSHEQKAFLEEYCADYKTFYKPKWQSIINIPKSLYNNKPLQVNYYYFNDVQHYVNEIIKQHHIVINTLIRTSEYIIHNTNKPKLLDMVDLISLNYERSRERVSSRVWRLIYNFEFERLQKYEKACLKNYDCSFLVNKQESEYCSQYGNVHWLPNGVNEDLFNYNKKSSSIKNGVAFFGRMDYQPNVDATIWFIENILPLINKEINFYIVGSDPVAKILDLAKSNNRIHVTGYVEDPFILLNSCFAIVAPMQTGGGIQNKILESMALGKIVITNSLGSNPIIGAKHGTHLLSEDNIIEYAKLVNDVFLNHDFYEDIEINARQFVHNNFTWSSYEQQLVGLIESLT